MKKALITLSLFALPLVAAAQTPTNVTSLISFIGDSINRLIPVVIALTVLVFFWGLAMVIFKSGAKGSKQGRQLMIYGVIALFVMVSVWGLIRLLQNTLGVSGAVPVTIPQVPQR